MGDRCNVGLKYNEDDPIIWLYSHWGGETYTRTLAKGLDYGRSRWKDEPYLARAIIQTWINAYGSTNDGDPTGVGIAPYICDNEHTLFVVDLSTQTVHLLGREEGSDTKCSFGYEKYIARFG
jgi:hypothetical protein